MALAEKALKVGGDVGGGGDNGVGAGGGGGGSRKLHQTWLAALGGHNR